jgi:hypothetical protein
MKLTKPGELRSFAAYPRCSADMRARRELDSHLSVGRPVRTQVPSSTASSRVLLGASAALFIVSSAFPVVASVLPAERMPRWMGIVDVVLAAALVTVGLVVFSRKPSEFAGPVVATGFWAYRALSNTFLVLLALFFVAGEYIQWKILLPGLAWRAWFLVLVLPAWVSVWRTEHRNGT